MTLLIVNDKTYPEESLSPCQHVSDYNLTSKGEDEMLVVGVQDHSVQGGPVEAYDCEDVKIAAFHFNLFNINNF